MATIAINIDVTDAKAIAAIQRLKGEIGGIKPPSPATAQGFTSIKDRVLEVTGAMQKMARILVSVQVILATVVTALGVRRIIEAADAWTMMSSRLSLVEHSAQGVIAVQERLFRLAQEVRLPLQDVVQLYSRLAFNAQQLGLNQDHLIAITKAVSQAMQISGSTAQESAAGVMQLTQALASNNLQGDELRSLLESQPRLLKAFADGLTIVSPEFKKLTDSGMAATGAIRAMAKAGKLDAGLILQALVTQTQALDTEFGKLSRTIGGAWTQVMNQLQQGLKGINTEPLTQALDRVRAWFADSSTQSSIKSFADGVMKALGSLAESVPKIVGFVQGHVESLMKVFDALAPKVEPVVLVLTRVTTLYSSLPPVVQEMGLVVAMLFGVKGFATLFLALSLMERVGNATQALSNSWQALKQGMPLSELQGAGSADVERFLKEQNAALLKFRGAQGLGGLPAPSQQDIDAYMKLYDAAKKPLDPIKATPKALDDVKKKVHETAGEIAELEATSKRMAVGLTLDGTAASTFTAEMTPLNVRLADASTLFSDVRVHTSEYSTALIGLSVSLSDVEAQTEGWTISADELQRSLAQTEPVLTSFEDRMKGQISLFPKTRVEADAYLMTLASITTTTQETAKATVSLKAVFSDVFDGITDILSLFGVKVGKVILMLQQLPRALGGIEKLAKGIGSVVGMIATPSSAVAALDWGGADGPISNIRQLGAASGDAAGDLGVFGGIVGMVSRLLGVFGQGLNAFGGKIGDLLTQMGVPGAAALGQAASGGIASFGIAQILGLGKGGQFASLGAGAIGSYFGGPGIGTIVGIAAGMVMESVQDFFKNPSFKNAITLGLNTIFPGIGTLVGKLFGGLFGSTQVAKLDASIAPFTRGAIGNAVDTSVPGVQVGGAIVNVGGNVMSNKKERALQLQLAEMLNSILTQVVDAAVRLIDVLPPALAAQLDDALSALESTGLEIVDKKWKGGSVKKFKKRVKGLADEAIQDLFEALNFGDIDLKELGGGERGDAAKGFDAIISALSVMSAVMKTAGADMTTYTGSLADFTSATLDYFKQFQQEGEAFADTVKRVGESLMGIAALSQQIDATIASTTNDTAQALDLLQDALQRVNEQAIAAIDALTVEVESGGSPEAVLAAAEAAIEAVTDAMDAQIAAVTELRDAVLSLNSAITGGVDLIVSLTQKINALRGQELSTSDFEGWTRGVTELFNALTDVNTRIALFASGLLMGAENMALYITELPRVAAGFQMIMAQIREMQNPAEAIASLRSLASAIETGLNAQIAAINNQTSARIAALNAERSAISATFAARRSALEAEKSTIQAANDAQREALQTQVDLAREWKSVLESVKSQLVDLFNLLAPTHPLTSLNEIRAQFNAAFAAFQANPSTEAATQVQDLARQLLQLAQQTPGYDLPSAAFQGLAADVQVALEAIQAFAAAQPTQEALQAQMAALEAEQAASLAAIDAQIAALSAGEAAALAGIDQQIASASAAAQAQIQQLQDLAAQGLEAIRAQLVIEVTELAAQQAVAAAALQAVLGDKSFEQFIAEKQAEAANLLRGIDETLKAYLGSIITGLGFGVPAMATGGYVPASPGGTLVRLGEGGRGEWVIPEGRGGGSKTEIIFSPRITVHADSSTNGRRVAEDIERAMLEAVRRGPFRKEVQDAAKGR